MPGQGGVAQGPPSNTRGDRPRRPRVPRATGRRPAARTLGESRDWRERAPPRARPAGQGFPCRRSSTTTATSVRPSPSWRWNGRADQRGRLSDAERMPGRRHRRRGHRIRARTKAGHPGRADVRGSERLGFLTHELRNLTNTAIIAFEVLKTGQRRCRGSTGAVLHRSLVRSATLIGRSLAESGSPRRSESGSVLCRRIHRRARRGRGPGRQRPRTSRSRCQPVDDDVVIEADRQVSRRRS